MKVVNLPQGYRSIRFHANNKKNALVHIINDIYANVNPTGSEWVIVGCIPDIADKT